MSCLRRLSDRLDNNGNLIKGLWRSLSSVLDAGSFDDANKDECWTAFHASFKFVICLRPSKPLNRRFESHTTLHFEPPEGRNFAASDSCFGYGVKKLHKVIQDKLRDLDYQIVQSLAYSMSGDDQRSIAFCSI